MSIPHRVRGVRILKAVSSPIRLQILNLLFDRGSLSYSELMSSLKMNPSRDAGRFAYHLKFLLKADLIETDVESKKYCLSDMGKLVIDVADRIEKKVHKPRSMIIRTSRFTVEEFDANKIANSLVKEAKMPTELAQKVATEAEKRLIKSKTKYLTAPLVREVVNAILVEKSLEEYRHKLTRLGLPIYDVTTLIEMKSKAPNLSVSVHENAGEMVLKEYTLLNVFPRDIADAHLSGALNIKGLSSWILKPNEILHDIRFFYQNGLNLEAINVAQHSLGSPQSLNTALSMTFNVLLHSNREIAEMQTLEYFNVFLAPFAKGLRKEEIKEVLRSFILDLNQHCIKTSLGLELIVPDFLFDKRVIGPSGRNTGKYGEFAEESQQLASLILEVIAEESAQKPIFNPRAVLEIRPETFADEKATSILLRAHELASERGLVCFVNLLGKNHRYLTFSGSGIKFEADTSEDWEIDTLRTGCLGIVAVNLPRIVYESEKDKARFFQTLQELFEMAARALEIKYMSIRQRDKGFLPFLMQDANGDQYFRVDNCARVINLIGVNEMLDAFFEKTNSDIRIAFLDELRQKIQEITSKISGRRKRFTSTVLLPDFETAERLARLDIERYGIAKVRFSGTRDKPLYSTVNMLDLQDGKVSSEKLALNQRIKELGPRGNFTVVDLGNSECKPDALLSLTKQLFEEHSTEFLTYNRKLTYCIRCRKSWLGTTRKCPMCGSTNSLTVFDQYA